MPTVPEYIFWICLFPLLACAVPFAIHFWQVRRR